MIDIQLTRNDPLAVVAVTGSIDSVNSVQLTQTISGLLDDGVMQLVVDFSGVPYTGSSGLRALLIGVKGSRKAGGDLYLCGTQPAVREVIVLAGFAQLMKLFDTRAEALAAFGH